MRTRYQLKANYPQLYLCKSFNALLTSFVGKNRMVSHLIKEGCNITQQTVQGDTPLHRCVTCLTLRNKRGHLLVGPLASNLAITNNKGHTPLLLLAERLDHAQISPDQFSDWLMAILEATMKIMDGKSQERNRHLFEYFFAAIHNVRDITCPS